MPIKILNDQTFISPYQPTNTSYFVTYVKMYINNQVYVSITVKYYHFVCSSS